MSRGTQTWQNVNIDLGFPLMNLNFQLLENRQTCQHRHTEMHTLGMALPGEQRGAAQGQATSHFSPPLTVPCQLGGQCNQPCGGGGLGS